MSDFHIAYFCIIVIISLFFFTEMGVFKQRATARSRKEGKERGREEEEEKRRRRK